MGAKFDRAAEGQKSTGSELERKYWPAMAAYAILAVVAWFMIGGGTVLIGGKAVEIRVLPLIVFALMAFRTYMARLADRMRRSSK
jgi:uncharacterized RDD family membrane protein YckC